MKGLPRDLMDKPNAYPVLLDRSNVAHRLIGQTRYRGACGLPGTPVELAQAIVYGRAWCAHVECWPPAHVRGH